MNLALTLDNTHFSSDIHLFHKKICEFQPNRAPGPVYPALAPARRSPFASVEEMNVSVVETVNEVVGPEGILYHLGDWSFGNNERTIQLMSRFRVCQLRMLHGNHDSADRSRSLARRANEILGTEMFLVVGDYERIKIDGQEIVLHHYPYRTWENCHHGSISLHGHEHGYLPPPPGKQVDVGWDSPWVTGRYENRPFSAREILAFAAGRPNTPHGPDHLNLPKGPPFDREPTDRCFVV